MANLVRTLDCFGPVSVRPSSQQSDELIKQSDAGWSTAAQPAAVGLLRLARCPAARMDPCDMPPAGCHSMQIDCSSATTLTTKENELPQDLVAHRRSRPLARPAAHAPPLAHPSRSRLTICNRHT